MRAQSYEQGMVRQKGGKDREEDTRRGCVGKGFTWLIRGSCALRVGKGRLFGAFFGVGGATTLGNHSFGVVLGWYRICQLVRGRELRAGTTPRAVLTKRKLMGSAWRAGRWHVGHYWWAEWVCVREKLRKEREDARWGCSSRTLAGCYGAPARKSAYQCTITIAG